MPVYCDAYALTVTLPDADQQFYLTHKATLTIDYTWTSAGPDDMDLFAFAPDGSLYVAYTYDGGQTWTTVDATPGNPIQRGCIWNGGGSNACRNLLDFNDASIDKQGRVLVAYTDGCANINYSYSTLVGGVQGLKHGPSQCNTDPSAYKDTDKVGFDGLVRQSCGQGLLRSADPGFTSGCPAPRVVSVHPAPQCDRRRSHYDRDRNVRRAADLRQHHAGGQRRPCREGQGQLQLAVHDRDVRTVQSPQEGNGVHSESDRVECVGPGRDDLDVHDEVGSGV